MVFSFERKLWAWQLFQRLAGDSLRRGVSSHYPESALRVLIHPDKIRDALDDATRFHLPMLAALHPQPCE